MNSILSLHYYLLVLKRMYILEPVADHPRMKTPLPVKAVLLLTMVGIFWLGILPGSVMNVISEISGRIFPPF